MRSGYPARFLYLTIFAVAMAFVESAVVVYLRAIYYPDGFAFPLKGFADHRILVEVCREMATIFMLLSVAFLAGRQRWERFASFLFLFGVWDIFYYVWLKVLLDWPAALLDWDILFLIPIPWIGPVIAPVSVSVLMIIFSIMIVRLIQRGHAFEAMPVPSILASAGAALILYSFMHDTGATLHQQIPLPYRYELLFTGNALFVAAFWLFYGRALKQKGPG